jgi:hypothetical protein
MEECCIRAMTVGAMTVGMPLEIHGVSNASEGVVRMGHAFRRSWRSHLARTLYPQCHVVETSSPLS